MALCKTLKGYMKLTTWISTVSVQVCLVCEGAQEKGCPWHFHTEILTLKPLLTGEMWNAPHNLMCLNTQSRADSTVLRDCGAFEISVTAGKGGHCWGEGETHLESCVCFWFCLEISASHHHAPYTRSSHSHEQTSLVTIRFPLPDRPGPLSSQSCFWELQGIFSFTHWPGIISYTWILSR